MLIVGQRYQHGDRRRTDFDVGALRQSGILKTRLGACASGQLSWEDALSTATALHGQVMGYALVWPGSVYEGELTRWTAEEEELWKVGGCSDVAYSVRVASCAALLQPVEAVCSNWTGRPRGLPHLGLPTVACLDEVLNARCRSPGGAEHDNGWDCVRGRLPLGGSPRALCVRLPVPIAACVVHGGLSSMVFSRSWRSSVPLFQDGWPGYRRQELGSTCVAEPLGEDSAVVDGVLNLVRKLRDWAPLLASTAADADDRESILGEVSSSVSFLRRLAASLATGSIGGATALPSDRDGRQKYSPEQLVALVRSGHLLKNRRNLPDILAFLLPVCLPLFLQRPMQEAIRQGGVLPSRMTMTRARFVFDVALSMHARGLYFSTLGGHEDTQAKVIYVWADSSPQGGRNWLLIEVHMVEPSMLAQVAAAVDRMAAAPGEYSRHPADLHFVCSHMQWHCPPPTALGSQREQLQHKVTGMLHSIRLESSPGPAFKQILSAMVGLTTDMGTELGISEAVDAEYLPASLLPQPLDPDTGGADLGEEWASDAHEPAQFLLSRALPVPGLLHVLDNLTQDMLKRLAQWDAYFPMLQAVCSLLQYRFRRERFIQMCVLQDADEVAAQAARVFKREFVAVTPWRWGTLHAVLAWLVPLRRLLAQHWDAARYADGQQQGAKDGDSKAGPLDLASITKAVRDPWFWGYSTMLLAIQSILDRLRAWGEACPCHCVVDRRQHARQQAFKVALEGLPPTMWKHCPMHGKRAPEMAAGIVEETLREAGQAEEVALLVALAGVDDHQRHGVLADWEAGLGHLGTTLQLKLRFWHLIPWHLMGMAHADQQVGRRCAAECVAQYDACPNPSRHHRVSVAFLDSGGDLRDQIMAFIGGGDLQALPQLQAKVLEFKYVPIVERTIEEKHSHVSRALGRKVRHHPVEVSLANRMREFEARARASPDFPSAIAGHMDRLKNAVGVCVDCGFQSHPSIQPLLARHARPDDFTAPATDLFYHCDTGLQHRGHKVAKAAQHRHQLDQAAKRRHVEAAEPLPGSDLGAARASVLRRCMLAHLQEVFEQAGPGVFFSLPLARPLAQGPIAGLVPLASCLEPPRSAEPAPLEDLDPDDGGEPLPRTLAAHADPTLATAASPPTQIFLRLVLSSPSLLHVVAPAPALADPLRATDIAATVHEPLPGNGPGGEGNPCIAGRPSQQGPAANASYIISALPPDVDPAALCAQCRRWQVQARRFYIRGAARAGQPQHQLAVTSLVHAGALPGSPSFLSVARGTELHAALLALEAEGHADLCEEGDQICHWALPAHSAGRLDTALSLAPLPDPVFSIRPETEPMAMNRFELLTWLEARGWSMQWRKRRQLPYPCVDNAAATKAICISGRMPTLPHELYLRCLAMADTLGAHGVAAVPHGGKVGTYRQMLVDAGLMEASSRPPTVPPLEDDDGGAPLAALEPDADPEAPLPGPPLHDEPPPPDDAEHAEEPAQPPVDEPDQPPISPAPPPPPPPHPEERRPFTRDPSSLNYRWGGFAVTLRTRVIGERMRASWFIRCPWHKLSQVTGCSAEMSVPGFVDDATFEESSERVQAWLQHWANNARAFNRRRDHKAFTFDPEEVPPMAARIAQRIDEVPSRGEVLADEELDALEPPPPAAVAAVAAGAQDSDSPSQGESSAEARAARADSSGPSGPRGSSSSSSSASSDGAGSGA